MNDGSENAGGKNGFLPMVRFDMDVGTFLSDWQHCDYISAYLARMVSHNRPDSILHSHLFSSACNELLEVFFRTRHPQGAFECTILRLGDVERVELTFPCTREERQYYADALRQAQAEDARERYINTLSGDLAPSRDMVLLELTIDYGATLRLEEADGDMITLIVDLPLGSVRN